MRGIIIGCGKTKSQRCGTPFELYRGSLWQTLRQSLRESTTNLSVMAYSGRYGLIDDSTVIEPYEHLKENLISTDCSIADLKFFTILYAAVGQRYIEPLRETLKKAEFTGELRYVTGRGIGDQRVNLRRFIRECAKGGPIYLCGPINARPDAECKDWREQAKKLLAPLPTLDPLRRDYRGMEESSVEEIVAGDLEDIYRSTALLVMFDQPSVGTSMEIRIAWQMGIPVHVVDISNRRRSPWLVYHATEFYDTLEDACKAIKG